GVEAVAQVLDRVLPEDLATIHMSRIEQLKKGNVPTLLAHRLADLRALAAATHIALVAPRTPKPLADVAATHFALPAFFRIERIVIPARDIRLADYFDRLALDRALDQIGDALRRLTGEMMSAGTPGNDAVERWVEGHAHAVGRARQAMHEIATSGMTLSK